jgi:hypothetical protein
MRRYTETINDIIINTFDFGKVPYRTVIDLLENDVTYNVLKFFNQETENKADLVIKQTPKQDKNEWFQSSIEVYVNTILLLNKGCHDNDHIIKMVEKMELKKENNQEENEGLIELTQLINCITKNGYIFEGETESGGWRNGGHNFKVVEFVKDIHFNHSKYGYINDAHIRVMIEYSLRFNEKNIEYDYSKYDPFIQKIVNEITGEDSS